MASPGTSQACGAEDLSSGPGTVWSWAGHSSEPVSFSETVTASQHHREGSTRPLHRCGATTRPPPSPPPESNPHVRRLSARDRASRPFGRRPSLTWAGEPDSHPPCTDLRDPLWGCGPQGDGAQRVRGPAPALPPGTAPGPHVHGPPLPSGRERERGAGAGKAMSAGQDLRPCFQLCPRTCAGAAPGPPRPQQPAGPRRRRSLCLEGGKGEPGRVTQKQQRIPK